MKLSTKLSVLARDLSGARVIGDAEIDITRVQDDSRLVQPGDLFVAVRGLSVDGHDYVDRALARGASAVVVERAMELPATSTQIVVPDTTQAMGALAARLAGQPGDRMTLVGVTGTNGKTTTTFLIEAILSSSDARPGVIGTVSYRYGGGTHPAPYTTPTPLVLHRVLADMVAASCTHAVLEVSSAALDMNRLAAVDFDVAAFTNLSQDHLDVHHSMEAYRAAKAQLFARHLKPDGTAVINVDDVAAPHMIAAAGDRPVIRVSARPDADADVRVIAARSSIAGIRAKIATPRGTLAVQSSQLLGAYNVANLAMAVAIGEVLGLDPASLARGIEAMPGVPGRVERVSNDRGLDILVDYAHTPDALTNVLAALKPLTRRRLICVFGCGGDRDPGKRVKMGAAVAEMADLAVVTSDNPRTEEPASIIDMILPALPHPFFVDADRRIAIQAAIAEATPGDIVLIAGKGHEDYQILGTEKIHFDDREEAARATALRREYPLSEVLTACAGQIVSTSLQTENQPDRDTAFSRVVIDGRIAGPGDLYVAIRGERHDGHNFCSQAVSAGATGLIVERRLAGDSAPQVSPPGDSVVIEVGDSRQALGAIARWHRRGWGARPLIAVTGSTGKTTTKELIRAALATTGRVHATPGSMNNETGVPLSLLGLRPYHDFAVIEMGMRGVGEIDYLVGLAEPDIGVVVNAGIAHIGVVGSREQIARGKAEIFGHLPGHGAAVFPADDPRLAEYARSAPRRVTFGREPEADVRLVSYRPAGQGADIVYRVDGRDYQLGLPLVGEHNAINGACALAVAVACGSPLDAAIAGLHRARAPSMRSQITRVAGRNLLVDCYNANPTSARAALHTVAELRRNARALAVLGDMLELGDIAPAAHREIGRLARQLDIDLVAVGEHRAQILAGADGCGVEASDPGEAAALALARSRPGDWILIKASRGMRLERVVDQMSQAAATATKPES
ncbi:MAG: bifunctional UDP-N-acetylmuramoyl-L-alanyl-D-glutamate--2,6-diaminopimelate ligase MurE/UDP-N-acetylmuramoyl-tripeptide--D-alanyl-D-alanine ligase MurF [Proteobacteria bacterium]|nr:bifunctional UDP-N-acetylmuramoyl-L-alanyl-D-glutamate--2,6-diaminopimelate ligase MurE/UDP-N-acetylmuramoyl-tripeptide--D-alanyl-D-alanine ligase MurF [Pseudomonadota bacterium]